MNQSSEPLPVHAMLSAGLLTDVPGSRKQAAGTGRTFSAKANGGQNPGPVQNIHSGGTVHDSHMIPYYPARKKHPQALRYIQFSIKIVSFAGSGVNRIPTKPVTKQQNTTETG